MHYKSSRKVPRGYKIQLILIGDASLFHLMSIKEVNEYIEMKSAGLEDPVIEIDDESNWGDYGNNVDIYVSGFIKLTAEEKAALAERRRKDREARKAKKEAQEASEKKQLEKLLEKYPEFKNA